ncbi:DoxX family protein [Streptomyces sp. NPDC052092]|uniref:DoxX family protein n=1 Tax=Streptomyces sp. NPDC052092 TaxID=3365685 RepID=UPI0037D6E66F
MSAGLLLLRLLLAGLLFGHATQKVLGWFRGQGLDDTAAVFEAWGFRPGRPMVLLAGTCELTAAVLLATGTATSLAAAIVMGTMIVAAAPNSPNGLWAHLGGYEVPFVYAALAFILAMTGPGSWSVDHAVGADKAAGAPWALAAAAAAVAAAVPALLLRRRNLRTSVPTAESLEG